MIFLHVSKLEKYTKCPLKYILNVDMFRDVHNYIFFKLTNQQMFQKTGIVQDHLMWPKEFLQDKVKKLNK